MTIPNTITYTNTSGEENKLSVYAGALTGVVEGWMRSAKQPSTTSRANDTLQSR